LFLKEKTMQNTTERKDVYSRITAQIVEYLEKGVRPWVRPWNAKHAAGRITRPLRHNGQPYSGINVLTLWMSALGQNFTAPIWMTYRQASELNAHVRKGEKGSLVVYANAITRTEHDDKTGEDVEREIPYMKGYTVFNVEQIDGLPEIYYAKAAPTLDPVVRIDHVEKFFAGMGAAIKHGGNRAYYAQELDYVQMPPFEAFRDAESYYATLAHELTHWTKHPQRLDRDFGRKSWGDEGYSREELVAELGSAFLCADLELHQGTTPPISRRGSKFSRTTTAPSSRQPPMPNVPPITSTGKQPGRFPRSVRTDFDPTGLPLPAEQGRRLDPTPGASPARTWTA
jgi:antirestriction protein ArdC